MYLDIGNMIPWWYYIYLISVLVNGRSPNFEIHLHTYMLRNGEKGCTIHSLQPCLYIKVESTIDRCETHKKFAQCFQKVFKFTQKTAKFLRSFYNLHIAKLHTFCKTVQIFGKRHNDQL